MNHFSVAQSEALTALNAPEIQKTAARVCLMVDLQCRFRVLADLGTSHDEAKCKVEIESKLAQAGGAFWTGEIWTDRSKDHPRGRLSLSHKALFESAWKEAKPIDAKQFVFVLSRRLSKDAWFDAASAQPWPLVPGKTPAIASFYSFKGGVGRTTALVAAAIQVARAGKRVLVVDLDLEAPGLSSIFPSPPGSIPDVGLLDYLIEKPVLKDSFDVEEIVHVYDQRPVVADGEIRVVGAGKIDQLYLEKLARLDYQRLSPANGVIIDQPPLHQLLSELRSTQQPDLILLDSRAGLHDVGGLALSSLAHFHVLFGLDSEQSWSGLRLAIAHLGRERLMANEKQHECLLAQAHVKAGDERTGSEERFRRRAYEIFAEEYYDAPGNPSAEWPIPDELADDEPHFPVPIVHDTRVMGYSDLQRVAEYLCEGDFKRFGEKLISKIGLVL